MKKRTAAVAALLAALGVFAAYMFWPHRLDRYVDYAEWIVAVEMDAGLAGEGINVEPWVESGAHTFGHGTPEFEAAAALLSGESCHRTWRYPDGVGERAVTLYFYSGSELLGGFVLLESGFVRGMENRDYTMGLFTGEPVRKLIDGITAIAQ